MPAAGKATTEASSAAPAGGIIEARRSKEAAYYGVDAMEFTDRATQIISDYVEGALADVRAQFVEALRRRGGGSGAAGEADAFYEEHVAPRAAAFLARMHKQLDRGADKFELYLARNIFKVPASSSAAAAAEKEAAGDAMDVVGSKEQEEEEGGAVPLPASASEVPAPQDEEAVDNLLTEARVRIRTLRRQRKAVEAMQAKAAADLEITQKEAHALRVRVLQALSLGEEGGEGSGGLAEMLEVVRAQGQEAAQLVLQAEGLIPQLAARQGQDGEGVDASSSQGSGVSLGAVVSIAPDMSDIRTHTKAHLKGLANALAPGTRV